MDCTHKGYTIIAVVEELVEGAEKRTTGKLKDKALKVYLDGEYRHIITDGAVMQ